MRNIDELIVHCSDTRPNWMSNTPPEAQWNEIRRWHVEGNGWSTWGYHFGIARSGQLLPGRAVSRVGAHVRDHNVGTIGVCLFGGHGSAATDAFKDHFTYEQETALVALTRALMHSFDFDKISGHNEYAAKACPGFDVKKWWENWK